MGKWIRLRNKTVAKKMWRAGKTVGLLACNLRFGGMMGQPCPTKQADYVEHLECMDWQSIYPGCTIEEAAWRSMYNNWQYYNANSECGYYAHYYLEVKDE
jgi:hypothetical protein